MMGSIVSTMPIDQGSSWTISSIAAPPPASPHISIVVVLM